MTLAHAPKNKAPIGLGWALCVSDSGWQCWLDFRHFQSWRAQQLRSEDEDKTTAVHNMRCAPPPSKVPRNNLRNFVEVQSAIVCRDKSQGWKDYTQNYVLFRNKTATIKYNCPNFMGIFGCLPSIYFPLLPSQQLVLLRHHLLVPSTHSHILFSLNGSFGNHILLNQDTILFNPFTEQLLSIQEGAKLNNLPFRLKPGGGER